MAAVGLLAAPARAEDTTTTTAPAAADASATTGSGSVSLIQVTAGGGGLDAMVPRPEVKAPADAPTVFEKFPAGAYTWDTDLCKTCIRDEFNSIWADYGLAALRGWGIIVTRALGWVWSAPQIPMEALDAFWSWLPRPWWAWATGILTAASLYVLSLLVRAKALKATQHVGWIMAMFVLGAATMSLPSAIIGTVNRGATTLAQVSLASVSNAAGEWAPTDGTSTKATFSTGPANTALRVAQDAWWRIYVVVPWANGEFGGTDLPAGTIDKTLSLKSGDVDNLTDFEKEVMAGKARVLCDDRNFLEKFVGGGIKVETGWAAIACMRQGDWRQYRDDVLEKLPGVGAWVNGNRSDDRAQIAWYAFIAAIPSGLVLIALSFGIVWWSWEFPIRVLLLPLMCFVGCEPKRGRKRFVEYGSKLLRTLYQRVIAGVALAVSFVLFAVSARIGARYGWGGIAMSQAIMTGMLVALWLHERAANGKPLRPRPLAAAKATARRVREAAVATGFAVGGAGAAGARVRRGAPDRDVPTEATRGARLGGDPTPAPSGPAVAAPAREISAAPAPVELAPPRLAAPVGPAPLPWGALPPATPDRVYGPGEHVGGAWSLPSADRTVEPGERVGGVVALGPASDDRPSVGDRDVVE